nr:hypothetical protein [Tanacetum cinerariifolium]
MASPSRKLFPVKEVKRVKRPAKKSATAPTAGVVIRDTPGVSVSKKKAPAKGDRGKGIELLSDAAILKAAQEKEALQKSKKDSPMLHASGSNDGVDSEDESDDINDDENPSFTLKDFDEEEHDEEHESDDDYENLYEEEDVDRYKDVDVRSLRAEHEKEREVVDEVASMMNVKNHQEESSTQAPSLFTMSEMAIPKTSTAHATTIPLTIPMITPLPQPTTTSLAPITIPTTTLILALPDFCSLFGFNQRVSTLETELSQLKQAESLTEFELKKILLDKIKKSESYKTAPEHKELYEGLVKCYNLDKDLFSSYGKAYSLKRYREDKDKDPSARSD